MSRGRLGASAVGAEIASVRTTITPRATMAFAAAIGATGSPYLEQHIAPPSFIVCLEWPLVNGAAYRAALGASEAVMQASLHVGQDSTFFRPIRAGDIVETNALIAAMRETRAGVLTTTRLETRVVGSGDSVATSWYSTIALDTTLEGPPAALDRPPDLPTPPSAIASTITTIPIARGLPHIYSECSGIWNPIHTEIDAARRAGLDDIIVHGTCSWAMAGNHIVETCCAGDPTRLTRLASRFHGRVVPGTIVRLSTASDGAAVQFTMTNHRGELAQRDGYGLISAGTRLR